MPIRLMLSFSEMAPLECIIFIGSEVMSAKLKFIPISSIGFGDMVIWLMMDFGLLSSMVLWRSTMCLLVLRASTPTSLCLPKPQPPLDGRGVGHPRSSAMVPFQVRCSGD